MWFKKKDSIEFETLQPSKKRFNQAKNASKTLQIETETLQRNSKRFKLVA